jgi:hypothetical protein
MWWIFSDLNSVSEKYEISSSNLQTVCTIHTASYSVGTGGSAVQHETRKNCNTVLYVKLPSWVICVMRLVLGDTKDY